MELLQGGREEGEGRARRLQGAAQTLTLNTPSPASQVKEESPLNYQFDYARSKESGARSLFLLHFPHPSSRRQTVIDYCLPTAAGGNVNYCWRGHWRGWGGQTV